VKILDVVRALRVFIAAQKRLLDCGMIDIKCTSEGLDREFEIWLG
jgi:hypothetical protein